MKPALRSDFCRTWAGLHAQPLGRHSVVEAATGPRALARLTTPRERSHTRYTLAHSRALCPSAVPHSRLLPPSSHCLSPLRLATVPLCSPPHRETHTHIIALSHAVTRSDTATIYSHCSVPSLQDVARTQAHGQHTHAPTHQRQVLPQRRDREEAGQGRTHTHTHAHERPRHTEQPPRLSHSLTLTRPS